MAAGSLPPHVLIFPLPLQGPVNSTFKLAELLSLSGLHVTFLLTDFIHSRLVRYTDIQSRLGRYPGLRIATISDGLPDDHPRYGTRLIEIFDSMETTTRLLLRDMLTSRGLSSDTRRPVTCILADGKLGFTLDVASEIGVPVFYIRTISACCLWSFFCLPKLIESGELPLQENDDLDTPIKGISGTGTFLRRRDLPGFCRKSDMLADPNVKHDLKEREELPRARGLILNTFEELEGPILSQIRTLCPNLYPIGPLHAHLKNKLAGESMSPSSDSNSLWKEDRTCLDWLDDQPPKSVIYVSFGSIAATTRSQFMEFLHGLVNSEKRFLWVIRPDSVDGEDWTSRIPAEASKGIEERGYIVGWAPQEEVLAHQAVGGFLTHSGWNSTLESVYEGVPMICWPYFLDQQVNSRFVEAWKLGLDMKDTCDRGIIEKIIRDLMDVRRDEFQRSADLMANFARNGLCQGGSAYSNLDRLIKDIGSMCSI